MKALRLTEEQYAAAQQRTAPLRPAPSAKAHKFGAQAVDGFDSTREAKRWEQLLLLQAAGAITDLRRQVPYLLLEAQHDAQGKLLERSCSLIVDFVYRQQGNLVLEDVKGYRRGTAHDVYVLKRKLLLARHGLRITEIERVA